MLPRFVIVPAIPIEKDSYRIGNRFYSETVSGGFDIYDNKEKKRLRPSYNKKEDAEMACEEMNKEFDCPYEAIPKLQTR
jgi:hypothetical protein